MNIREKIQVIFHNSMGLPKSSIYLIIIINNNNRLYSPHSHGLPTNYWPHFHLFEDRGERSSASLGIIFGQYVKPPSHFWFKSVLETSYIPKGFISTIYFLDIN